MQEKKKRLLETKIQIPEVQKDFQKREALLAELEAEQEKLVVLHATIGYGKTVLLSQFVERTGYICAWYHLDSLDNEASTFVQYLTGTLKRALVDFNFEEESYLQAGEMRLLQLARDLVMELTDYLSGLPGQKLLLVLDDFQVLENEEIFGLLEELLDHAGSQLVLMAATKGVMPNFFTKYILRNQGKVLNFERLSFQREEVYALLERLLSKEEADKYSEMIWRNMEGWPAGVMFAALYLRQAGNRLLKLDWDHISEESLVQNYIMHELFRSLPYEIQQFLLCTSFASELQPGLCNAICGITNAGGILKYLLQENMFIIHVGENSGSYRYHSIFQSFLQEQAGEEMKRKISGKLARYYMKQQEMPVAARYALDAGEPELLVTIVEKVGISMFQEGKRKLLEEYFQQLLECQDKWTPEVWYVKAVCDFWNGDREKGFQELKRAAAEDKLYLAYISLYEGLAPGGKEEEKAGKLQEACRLLLKKNRKLPPMTEEEKRLAEPVWAAEAGRNGQAGTKLLQVTSFGSFRVRLLPGGRELAWRTRKAMELFAYLVDLEGKPVERRILLEQLWPEDPPNNAVAMLHNMIYSIRRELNVQPGLEELIQYKNRQYRLNMALIDSDLERVKRLCTLAEQGRAEALWEAKEQLLEFWGVYLEEIGGSWCAARRTYFERAYGKACRLAASECEKRQEYETAAILWREYMEADRYSEEALLGLLRVYGRLGERGQMKKVFESARKLFRDELGLELGEEILRVYEEGMGKAR